MPAISSTGKSTARLDRPRIVNNTGIGPAPAAPPRKIIQSTASPYLSVGQALPTPAPETVEEFRVNTSMYDGKQGSTSGAHIDMSTLPATNAIHGSAYVHRGTDWLNAAPYFYNQDANIPANEKVPQLPPLHRWRNYWRSYHQGQLFGLPVISTTHASDLEIGTSRTAVPFGSPTNRSPAALAAVAFNNWGTSFKLRGRTESGGSNGPFNIDPVAYALLTAKLPNGQYLFPRRNPNFTPTLNFPENVFINPAGLFHNRPGRIRSRLPGDVEGYAGIEVLLPA